jgi:hypothetical protein
MDEQLPLDKLARIYRKMRSEVQRLTQEYESQIEAIKEQQQAVTNAIKDIMMATGQKTARTDEGTIMLGTKTRYTTHDWDSFKQFVVEHEALDLFEKRISQGNMKQFLEENPTLVPPGLDASTEYTITVRKPTK